MVCGRISPKDACGRIAQGAKGRVDCARNHFKMEWPHCVKFHSGTNAHVSVGYCSWIDFTLRTANNLVMARPEVAHRIKSYSAATGVVYQYTFVEVQKARRGLSLGTEYVYIVSVDRKENFPLTVFVRQSAVDKWEKRQGRKLSGTEEYAVAKMRLFQAFDEVEDLAMTRPDLAVDDANIDTLLARLDI
jgi:hypothetical protein